MSTWNPTANDLFLRALEIAGPDEEQAMEAICALVRDCFGEGQ